MRKAGLDVDAMPDPTPDLVTEAMSVLLAAANERETGPERVHARAAHALIDSAVAAQRALLAEVAAAGVEFSDARVGYVTVQIDRETWDALHPYAERHASAGRGGRGMSACACGHASEEHEPECKGTVQVYEEDGLAITSEQCGCVHYEADEDEG